RSATRSGHLCNQASAPRAATVSSMRMLITGGAGFIGSNFVRFWADRHPDDAIVVLDALTYAGNRATLAPFEQAERLRFVKGDIANQDLVEHLLAEEQV